MSYIFSVDKTNFKKCIEFRLFGVPNTARAYNQIFHVSKGEKLFLYIYGPKKIYGIYRAKSSVFTEKYPEKGPWTGRKRDRDMGYYPHRIEIEPLKDYEKGINIDLLERGSAIGIDRHSFNGKSAMYIDEFQTERIEKLLREENKSETRQKIEYKILPREEIRLDIEKLKGGREAKLQLLTQRNIQKLEEGLRVADAYYNISECLSCKITKSLDYAGQIDILGRDKQQNFVILELKVGRAEPTVEKQLLNYSRIIERFLARRNDVSVKSMIICKEASKALQRVVQKPHAPSLYSYHTDFKSSIKFEEIS